MKPADPCINFVTMIKVMFLACFVIVYFSFQQTSSHLTEKGFINPWKCEKWFILLFDEASIKKIDKSHNHFLHEWCFLMIQGAESIPALTWNSTNIKILRHQEQEDMIKKFPFLSKIPLNHRSRKNFGFVYAISNGGQFIWDIKEDLEMIFDHSLKNNLKNLFEKQQELVEPYQYNKIIIDLNELSQTNSSGNINSLISSKQNISDVGMVQFQKSVKSKTTNIPFLLPLCRANSTTGCNGVYTTERGQSNLFFNSSFWSLLLPIGARGEQNIGYINSSRIGGIYRSLLSQRLSREIGKRIVIYHDLCSKTNNHDEYSLMEPLLVDENVDLLNILEQWRCRTPVGVAGGKTKIKLSKCIFQLWNFLRIRQLLSSEDIFLIAGWLEFLGKIHYQFPDRI